MIMRGVVGRGFRIAVITGDQIWFEVSDPDTATDGLREFLRAWVAAWVRPKGEVFRLWVGRRDFMRLLWDTTVGLSDIQYLDGYLLVRSTPDRPCGGCSNRGWVLIHPSHETTGQPTVVGIIEDRRPKNTGHSGHTEET